MQSSQDGLFGPTITVSRKINSKATRSFVDFVSTHIDFWLFLVKVLHVNSWDEMY